MWPCYSLRPTIPQNQWPMLTELDAFVQSVLDLVWRFGGDLQFICTDFSNDFFITIWKF